MRAGRLNAGEVFEQGSAREGAGGWGPGRRIGEEVESEVAMQGVVADAGSNFYSPLESRIFGILGFLPPGGIRRFSPLFGGLCLAGCA